MTSCWNEDIRSRITHKSMVMSDTVVGDAVVYERRES